MWLEQGVTTDELNEAIEAWRNGHSLKEYDLEHIKQLYVEGQISDLELEERIEKALEKE